MFLFVLKIYVDSVDIKFTNVYLTKVNDLVGFKLFDKTIRNIDKSKILFKK